MDYWGGGGGGGGGAKGYVGPPLQIFGGGSGPPSSYAYVEILYLFSLFD